MMSWGRGWAVTLELFIIQILIENNGGCSYSVLCFYFDDELIPAVDACLKRLVYRGVVVKDGNAFILVHKKQDSFLRANAFKAGMNNKQSFERAAVGAALNKLNINAFVSNKCCFSIIAGGS